MTLIRRLSRVIAAASLVAASTMADVVAQQAPIVAAASDLNVALAEIVEQSIYDRMQAFDDRGAGLMAAVLLIVALVTLTLTTVIGCRVGRRRG